MQFVTANQMRAMDHKAINECGVPGVVLMENAGRGAAVLVQEAFGAVSGRKVVMVVGRGNNGGDGFVMARIFQGFGAAVSIYLLSSREHVSGDARINMDAALKLGLEVVEIENETDLDRIDFSGADFIVDALLGTGLNSEVTGLYREMIVRINNSKKPVAAVDLPSGVDADTGRILGAAVRADLTVTFGLPKVGHFLQPAESLVGRLEVVDIGLPVQVMAEVGALGELLTEESLKGLIKPRLIDSHKGDFGHLLCVAGSTGKTGAAALSSLAAARSGAGLVTLGTPATLNPILEQKLTEPMTEPLPEDEPGFLSSSAADRILELAQGKSALAIGPGLSTSAGAALTVLKLVKHLNLPMVIDADGINALAGNLDVLKKTAAEIILTPHPGEMSRLVGKSTTEIQADRLETAAGFAAEHNLILVLKGYRTVIAAPDGRVYLNTTGGPHMASGGMGDVLTGIIGGLAAQGLSGLNAARLGVFVHGLAGDMAAAAKGPIGMLASDLLPFLPGLWSRFMAQ